MTSPSPVVTAHLDAVPTLTYDSVEEADWKPLRHHLGIGAFGVNAWVASDEGGIVIERHDEVDEGHEELYLVVRGSARFTVGDETIEAPAGTLLFLADPSVTRQAVSTAPYTLVLTVGATRGQAFSPSPWEARALRDGGATGAPPA